MGNLQSKVALRRAYDMDNGIYTEALEGKEAFSLIIHHSAEAAANLGKYDELIESFAVHDIGKYFNFSFTDWISQPNDIVQKQIKAAIRWKQRELIDANAQVSSILGADGKPIIR